MRHTPARADSATLLSRALRVSAAAHGVTFDALSIADRPWASATFEGVRHEARLSLSDGDPKQWLDTLADAELPMRGNIVADLAIDSIVRADDGIAATLIVLTLAER